MLTPISVYDAPDGRPFTIEIGGPTIQDMHMALSHLIQMGYGGTEILRADYEGGPCYLHALELYDSSELQKRGDTNEDTLFLLC